MRQDMLTMVYSKAHRILRERMDVIVAENARLSNGVMHMRLRGKFYSVTGNEPLPGTYCVAARPFFSLKDTIQDWLDDLEELQSEQRMVSHSLGTVLTTTLHIDDYLGMLPVSLHQFVEKYREQLPSPASVKRLSAQDMATLQQAHSPYLALMGQRYVRSLLL